MPAPVKDMVQNKTDRCLNGEESLKALRDIARLQSELKLIITTNFAALAYRTCSVTVLVAT